MPDHISREEAQHPFFAGIDVGGTNIKFGVVDEQGRTLAATHIPTKVEQGPQVAVKKMGETIRQMSHEIGLDESEVVAVGLGTPGTMDLSTGMLLQPHNLPGWWDFPIRDRLAEATGKPVVFANDANAAAYGEFWVGRGAEDHSIVLLTLGTGIGGGIIVRNQSIDGQHGHGSECGHIVIDQREDARICPCGQRGHLEAYVSAKSVVKRTEEKLAEGRGSTLSERFQSGKPMTALMVAEEAERDDLLSIEIVLETARILGIGIVSLMHTIDPGAVILGGAMDFGGPHSVLGQNFLEHVRAEVRRRAFPIPAAQTVIDFAALGGAAGYIGAAGIARAQYQNPSL